MTFQIHLFPFSLHCKVEEEILRIAKMQHVGTDMFTTHSSLFGVCQAYHAKSAPNQGKVFPNVVLHSFGKSCVLRVCKYILQSHLWTTGTIQNYWSRVSLWICKILGPHPHCQAASKESLHGDEETLICESLVYI